MSTVSPEIQDLARRLLALETVHGEPPAAPEDAAVRVFEKLRATLSKLMGVVGFRALLSRSLAVAKAEAPALGGVKVLEDGALKGFTPGAGEQGPETAGDGYAVLVGQFLGLLVTFIGKPLTLRMIRDAWPDFSIDKRGGKGEEENI